MPGLIIGGVGAVAGAVRGILMGDWSEELLFFEVLDFGSVEDEWSFLC